MNTPLKEGMTVAAYRRRQNSIPLCLRKLAIALNKMTVGTEDFSSALRVLDEVVTKWREVNGRVE